MEENNIPEKEEPARPDGSQTGAEFVSKIGVVGCIFFLAVFIGTLLFCFLHKPAPPADTSEPTEQTQISGEGDNG